MRTSLAGGSQDAPLVHTACNGVVVLNKATPQAVYQGETIYFCLPECRKVFEKDPAHSCLVLRGQI